MAHFRFSFGSALAAAASHLRPAPVAVALLLGASACSAFSSSDGKGLGGDAEGGPSQPASDAGAADTGASSLKDSGASAVTPPVLDAAAPVADSASVSPPGPDAAVQTPADAAPTPVADAKPPTAPIDAAPGPGPADAQLPPDAETPGNFKACAIVTCGAAIGPCCKFWYSFGIGADSAGDDSIVTAFDATAGQVKGTFQFKAAKQEGALGIAMPEPQAVKRVKVTFTASGPAAASRITLESQNGAQGCGYALAANGEANLADSLFCWGGAFTPSQVAVRAVSTGAGRSQLTITKVELQ